jgi:dephospho-CoA kinase
MTTRVLITGMSGAGKSVVVDALAARGYRAIDADQPGLSHEVAVPDTEVTGIGRGRDWVWRQDRISEVLDTAEEDLLFLAGCSPNQGMFRDRFDHVVLLTAPAEVTERRLRTRTTNDFGKEPGELTRTLHLQQEIEPLLRAHADLEVDTRAPLDDVVGAILTHVRADA